MHRELNRILDHLGLPDVSRETYERFALYARRLEEVNAEMNLTAITGTDAILRRHFGDSLALLIRPETRCETMIDVGSGAGFPGLPLRIYAEEHPEFGPASITLMDATGKKVEFISRMARELGLTSVRCVHARAEELAREPREREAYNCAVSRAVAAAQVLAELCLPFVSVGGAMLTLKAASAEEEAAAAATAFKTLGGGDAKLYPYKILPDAPEMRILTVKKEKITPEKYPRPFGQMKKRPL